MLGGYYLGVLQLLILPIVLTESGASLLYSLLYITLNILLILLKSMCGLLEIY